MIAPRIQATEQTVIQLCTEDNSVYKTSKYDDEKSNGKNILIVSVVL